MMFVSRLPVATYRLFADQAQQLIRAVWKVHSFAEQLLKSASSSYGTTYFKNISCQILAASFQLSYIPLTYKEISSFFFKL